MIVIKIPTIVDMWHWLLLFAYRRYMADHKGSGTKPEGIPGNRDPDNPCTGYEPRKKRLGDWGDCDTDGHYLCAGCCHRKKPEEP